MSNVLSIHSDYLTGTGNNVLFMNYYEESLELLKVSFFIPTKPLV